MLRPKGLMVTDLFKGRPAPFKLSIEIETKELSEKKRFNERCGNLSPTTTKQKNGARETEMETKKKTL